jgi:hypothetical protein
MPSPTNPRRRTLAQGRALIAAWQASGLSARAFCQARHLSLSRIDFWKRRLRQLDQAESATAPSSAFIQVQSPPPARPAPTTSINATLPNGLIVAIPPGSDLGWTRQVLTALLGVEARC